VPSRSSPVRSRFGSIEKKPCKTARSI
jgi:hypothetical protein